MYLNNNVSCSQDGVQGCKYYQYFYDQIKDCKGGLNMLMLRIIHRRDNMYDVYNGMFGQWLCSYESADKVFLKLANYGPMQIEFVNGVFE